MSFLVSLLFGIAVGAAYGFAGVKSPAPPLVALVGLLGFVIGEQGVIWLKHHYAAPHEKLDTNSREDDSRSSSAPPKG